MSERTAAQGTMLANRLRKNARQLRKWAGRMPTTAYRLYDRDIPEIALAIDWYAGRLHIAAYRREREELPAGWLEAMAAAAAAVLDIPAERVFCKERRRQRGTSQYERSGDAPGSRFEVQEAGMHFEVDLATYLDTGLFLDHRPMRRLVRERAEGARVLNLFCYTGSITVAAAMGGARATTSVDLSRTYLQWTHRNLMLNDLAGPRHDLVQADAVAWLQSDDRQREPRYDLAILDPPSFSNSKRMRGVLDVQRDHVGLCRATAGLLKPGGTLYFSTNLRRFRPDLDALADLHPTDITAKTIPRDFRNKRIHTAFELRAPEKPE